MEVVSKPNYPDVLIPAEPSCRVWRYMELSKYLDMLLNKKLFFVRADRLDDRFEGSWPSIDKQKHLQYWKSFKTVNPPLSDEQIEKLIADDEKLNQNRQKDTFINCWHVSESESYAMWKVYGQADKSIAIQTSFEKLQKVLLEKASLGLVEYFDFDSDSLFANKKYGACPYYFKRKSFEYERELRCVYQRVRMGPQDPNQQYVQGETGIHIDIDVQILVDRVYISPKTEGWFYTLVNDLTEKLGYRFPVLKSGIDKDPIF